MRKLAILCALLLAASTVTGQGTEYGKPEELKGLTKIFIDTGGDLKNRERITAEIEKAKLGFALRESAEGAEIVLDYANAKEREADYSTVNVGRGRVYVVAGERRRVVMSFQDEESTVWEKKPATNFARTFLKAYRKANGLK